MVYGICDANCKYEVYTAEEVLTILQQMIDGGSLAGIDASKSPIVKMIRETKSSKDFAFWVGTEAEFNALDPAPAAHLTMARISGDGMIYLCTDDTTIADWQRYVLEQAEIIAGDTVNARIDEIAATKQEQHTTRTAKLTAAGWSNRAQTVTVDGVTASNTVIIAPAPASHLVYGESQTRCTAQAAGKLTFTCESAPDVDVTVNIIILEV